MIKVLFVCLGNICRSPMAESVFAHKIKKLGLDEMVSCDSAGTGSWHSGEQPNPRTITELEKHDIPWCSTARQVRADDFNDFHYIIAMDRTNLRDLEHWHNTDVSKLTLMLDWAGMPNTDVPDPYYGGQEGFSRVFDLVDRATDGLIVDIRSKLK